MADYNYVDVSQSDRNACTGDFEVVGGDMHDVKFKMFDGVTEEYVDDFINGFASDVVKFRNASDGNNVLRTDSTVTGIRLRMTGDVWKLYNF